MQKKAITVDPAVVGRYALGGALTGGAIASTLNLAHMIRQMRDERKKRTARPETDENTIVLTLPSKQAEEPLRSLVTSNSRDALAGIESSAKPTKADEPRKTSRAPVSGTLRSLICSNARNDLAKTSEAVEQDRSGSSLIKHISGHQYRDLTVKGGPQGQQSREKVTGKFGHQLTKAGDGTTGWPTLTAASLAALAGGAGGAALVNKMYEVQREKRLKAELAAAKQEYMDLLTGHSVKGAEAIEQLFPYTADFEKQADSAFGLLNYPMAAMALMTILGSGGTAYLTKKILDEKLRETSEKSLDIPKVKRIVLQSTPAAPGKQASAEEFEAVQGGLMAMMDFVAGTDRFLGHPTVKAAMEQAGVTPQSLQGTGSPADWDTIQHTLGTNPELRRALSRLAVDYTVNSKLGRGMGHMALALPGAQGFADKKILTKLDQLRYQVPPGGAAGLKMQPGQPKQAQALDMGASMLGSLMGKKLTGQSNPVNQEELVKAVLAAQDEASQEKRMKGMKVRENVRIEAKDPAATDYLEHHKHQVAGLVRRLAQEGQL